MTGPTATMTCRWLAPGVALGIALAQSAHAEARSDAKRVAPAEMAASEASEAAHDHRAAFDHALGAWQLGPGSPAYLLRAAEQAVLAGQDDKAEPQFKKWLSLGNRDLAHDLGACSRLADIVPRFGDQP